MRFCGGLDRIGPVAKATHAVVVGPTVHRPPDPLVVEMIDGDVIGAAVDPLLIPGRVHPLRARGLVVVGAVVGLVATTSQAATMIDRHHRIGDVGRGGVFPEATLLVPQCTMKMIAVTGDGNRGISIQGDIVTTLWKAVPGEAVAVGDVNILQLVLVVLVNFLVSHYPLYLLALFHSVPLDFDYMELVTCCKFCDNLVSNFLSFFLAFQTNFIPNA